MSRMLASMPRPVARGNSGPRSTFPIGGRHHCGIKPISSARQNDAVDGTWGVSRSTVSVHSRMHPATTTTMLKSV
jgi:hypothetical protein